MMKLEGFIKKIISAGIVLASFLVLCFYVWNRDFVPENGGENLSVEPDEILLADIASQCEVWERRYGEENTLPVEIFQDLQRYVAGGEGAEALLAYRQEELICTVEELKEICPDFEMLVEQFFKSEYGENRLETNKIYHLEAGQDKNCFLVFYRRFDTDEGYNFLATRLLIEGEDGWQLKSNSTGMSGGIDDYEVFAREEAGQKVYYLLKAYGLDTSFTHLTLAMLSEEFYVPMGGWDVELIRTGVRTEILFQEAESDLAAQAKEYVEENAWFLAWMQQEDMPIWGDEDEQEHSEIRKSVDSVIAYTGIEQKWLIHFDKGTVTFQMAEAEDGMLLEAYAHEGDSEGRRLLSCRIYFIREAGIDWCTPAYDSAFDFNGLTIRNTEDSWFRDEVQKHVWEEQQQRNIAPWQEETSVSEELYKLLREEAWTGLFGEENVLLDSYRLDLTEDTEIFMQRAAETDWRKSIGGLLSKDWECKWAYRWFEEDGSENFLSCINYNFAKDSIQWWKMGEWGLEEYDYVTENTKTSQMICCEGRFYCITEAIPEYRGGRVYTSILEIGDSENWRTSGFSIRTRSFDDQELACIPLYEAEGLSPKVKDYVQEWYEAIGEACIEKISLFSGTEDGKELTAEENRMLNCLSDGEKDIYSNHRYFVCDVDNDGIAEYGHAGFGSELDVTFYEKENGEFRVIPLEEEVIPGLEPDWSSGPETLVKTSVLLQLWCEKMGDTTYLFTVNRLAYSPDCILRIRVLKDDYVEDKAIYLLKADMEEHCYDWDILEITPTAEDVAG